MLESFFGILWSFVAGVIWWLILFVVVFAVAMLLIVGIGKTVSKVKKTTESLPIEEFVETPEYIEQLAELLHHLTNYDEKFVGAIHLFRNDKRTFGMKYLEDIGYTENDVADLDYWTLMFLALSSFGYLSYNDWKYHLNEVLLTLAPVFAHYGINASLYDSVSDKHNITEPEVCPTIASHLPNGYVVLDIYTGEDSFAITIATSEIAKKVVRISDAIRKPDYNTGVRIFQ